VSQAVGKLHNAINKLSSEVLPNQTLESLHLGWRDGTLPENEIQSIRMEYGNEIWGAEKRRRHVAVNPKSHLLIVGEGEGFYITDLFWRNLEDRA